MARLKISLIDDVDEPVEPVDVEHLDGGRQGPAASGRQVSAQSSGRQSSVRNVGRQISAPITGRHMSARSNGQHSARSTGVETCMTPARTTFTPISPSKQGLSFFYI